MTDHVQAHTYPLPWRVIAGVLVAVSRAGLLAIGASLLAADAPVPLLALVRALAALVMLPGAAALLIERAFAAEVEVRDVEVALLGVNLGRDATAAAPSNGTGNAADEPLLRCSASLVINRRGLRLEVPCAAIARVAPWAIPLPGPGFSLWLRSGRRLRYGLQADDPTPLLSALAAAGSVESADAATRHPSVLYAHVKYSRAASVRWYYLLAKFAGFGLLPTAVWFNAHQHIAYGGLFGQYYLEGLSPYLKTFLISWGLASIYLLLYASVWRALAEVTAVLTAWIAPVYAAQVRRLSEIVCRVMYYGGVPVLVLLPFLL